MKKSQIEDEIAHGSAVSIVNSIEPSIMIAYPPSNVKITDHLIAILESQKENIELNEEETNMYNQAMSLLKDGTPARNDQQDLGQDSEVESFDSDNI